jgi:serine/threonine-protein phosphatase PGAM5
MNQTKRLLLGLAIWGAAGLAGHDARGADAPPAHVRYVYLIRHGDYDRNDAADDRTANGLNALGHEQARLIGARLAGLPVKIHSLVSSNYTRARDTAAEIGSILGMPAQEDSLLHECTPNSDRADFMSNHKPDEIAACEANLVAAWARYMQPSPDADTHDVLVCHGNVIRWFVSRALGVDTKRWGAMDIGNGSLTVLAVRADGSTRLVLFSDVGHLPVVKQTWTGRGAGWTITSKK